MTADQLREMYLKFFESKGHIVISGGSLIPQNDPTVLFTTAGMHPLVPYLLGEPHPAGKRLCNYQKCMRTGDIDDVGDTMHLTFFEMLGNWSLGDYFKEEAIVWSFEFLTSKKYLGFRPDHLFVTVFEGNNVVPMDQESVEIWKKTGIPQERIFALPMKITGGDLPDRRGRAGRIQRCSLIPIGRPAGPIAGPAVPAESIWRYGMMSSCSTKKLRMASMSG